jgi:hypothetical protein
MIVDIIKRTALIEVRTGPMGRAGERGIQGQQGVPGQQGIAGTTSWIGLTDKPATFPPSAHTHSAADIVTGALAIANGGTGSTTALGAREALGLRLAQDVQPYSAVLDALLPLNVQDTPGDVGTTLQLGSGANYVDDNATTSGGDAGEIRLVGGDAYGDALIQRGGGDAGSILMLGGNASDQYDGGAAGTVNTSGSGQYFGGSLQMNATDQNAGSINTQAGGNLTMGTANVSGPAVAGTMLTDASSLPAANLTGTIANARLPATMTGLTSVTSTAFVGSLTGTASGNLALAGGRLTGALTLPNAIFSDLSLTGSQETNTLDVSTTWNTTGNPSLIYGRATNTASGASARLLDLGTTAAGSLAWISKAGNLTIQEGTGTADLGLIFKSTTFTNGIYGNSSTLRVVCNGQVSAYFAGNQMGVNSNSGTIFLGVSADLLLARAAAASLQLGTNHATTATAQTLKAHDVTTGTGANLILRGGTGSVANGAVVINSNAIFSNLSLTGSQATNTLDVSTTWNTTGNPSLIYGRATNTASGSTANLIDLGTVAGGSLFRVTKGGTMYVGNVEVSTNGIYGAPLGWPTSPSWGGITQLNMYSGSLTTGFIQWNNDMFLYRAAAASLQLGTNHATTATAQTIKAHNVTTGTGANLILSGGTGSVANGVVIISGLPTSNPGPGILWNNAGTPAIGT